MDARDVYNLYEAYRSVYEDRESLNEDVDYDLYEAKMDSSLSRAEKEDVRGRRYVGKTQGEEGEKNYDKNPVHSRGKWVGASRLRAHKQARGNQHNEEVDLYDVVLEHLLDEGYCDDLESAEVIMANMSEEWLDGILEAKVDKIVDTQLQKSGVDPVTRMQAKMGARKSRRSGLTPRTGRQWVLAQKISDMKDRQTEYPLRGSKRGPESPAD